MLHFYGVITSSRCDIDVNCPFGENEVSFKKDHANLVILMKDYSLHFKEEWLFQCTNAGMEVSQRVKSKPSKYFSPMRLKKSNFKTLHVIKFTSYKVYTFFVS